MKLYSLSKGKYTKVDDCVYEALVEYGWKWNCNSDGYAAHSVGYTDDRGKWRNSAIKLHRWILESFYNIPLGGLHTDHKNRDTLDNQLVNLRVVTANQNQWNRAGTKGVCYDKRLCKWRSRIKVNCKEIYLGYFDTHLEAAQAYDKAAAY